MAQIVKHLRDTLANWVSNDPVMASGQMGLVLNASTGVTEGVKMGNGTDVWSDLPYISGSTVYDELPVGGQVFDVSKTYEIDQDDDISITLANSGHSSFLTYAIIKIKGNSTNSIDWGIDDISLDGDALSNTKMNCIVIIWLGSQIIRASNQTSNIIAAPVFVSAEIGTFADDILSITVDTESTASWLGTPEIILTTDGAELSVVSFSSTETGDLIHLFQLNRDVLNTETITIEVLAANGIVNIVNNSLVMGSVAALTAVTNNIDIPESSALLSSASSQYLQVPNNAAFDLSDGTNDVPFDFTFYIEFTDLDSTRILYTYEDIDEANQRMYAQVTSSGLIRVRLYDGAAYINHAATNVGANIFAIDTRYKIRVTYDGSGNPSGIASYKDDVLMASTTATSGSYTAMDTPTSNTVIKFGGESTPNGGDYLNGKIDNININIDSVDISNYSLDETLEDSINNYDMTAPNGVAYSSDVT